MKKLLATLNVYVDMDETATPSGIRKTDGNDYELVMYPNQDCIPCDTRHAFQTIMAHELGHFVAMVTRDPSHHPANRLMAMLAGKNSAAAELPGEIKAWELARTISPDLDRKTEQECTDSYREAAEQDNEVAK